MATDDFYENQKDKAHRGEDFLAHGLSSTDYIDLKGIQNDAREKLAQQNARDLNKYSGASVDEERIAVYMSFAIVITGGFLLYAWLFGNPFKGLGHRMTQSVTSLFEPAPIPTTYRTIYLYDSRCKNPIGHLRKLLPLDSLAEYLRQAGYSTAPRKTTHRTYVLLEHIPVHWVRMANQLPPVTSAWVPGEHIEENFGFRPIEEWGK